METKIRTSDDAYSEYLKLKAREEKLKKDNNSFNLLSFNKIKSKRYFISVEKITKVNLTNKEEKLVVNSDLPFIDWNYRYGDKSVNDFLEDLREYCKFPIYKFPRQRNRKQDNKISYWSLPDFRKEKILFENIEFKIGELARKKLIEENCLFIEKVKDILETQKELTNQEKTDFDKYFFLIEKVDDLKRQIPRESYSYNSDKDDTLKFTITKQEYNEKLKILETELEKLCSKYKTLKMPSIDYKEIVTQTPFKDWCDENIDDLRENWDDNMDDEDRDEFDGDFDKFLEKKYDDYLEYSDFDE